VIEFILPTQEDEMTNRNPIALYVDYDIDEWSLVAAILENRGFSLRTSKSALNAMELVSKQGFDVVIIDDNLPEMTGVQLAKEIRAVEPSATIILLPGRPHVLATEVAFVDVHIVKGSLLDTLIETVQDLLRSPNLTPERAA
jgi:two-component system, cell cycle sensor histidine kinase and response regulator CckA